MKKILSIILSISLIFSVVFTGISTTAETTDTDLGVYVDIIPSYVYNVSESTNDSGETVYTTTTWQDGSIVFDYLIEEDYVYYLSFDYMGHNYAGNQKPSASTVATPTTKAAGKVLSAINLNVPHRNGDPDKDWNNVKARLKGSDLLASGGKYLAVHWSQVDPSSNYKNFKIMKLKGGSNAFLPATLHSKVSETVVDGEMVYMGLNWQGGSMTFDYIVEEGYTYYLSFEYKGHNWAAMQGVSASTVATATTNINSKVDTAVGITVPHRNGDPDTDYNIVVAELKGTDLLASGGKYFCLHWCQLGQDAYFKNISIIKVKSGEEFLRATKLHNTTLSLENGESVYTSGTWNAGSITFDYEIEDGEIIEMGNFKIRCLLTPGHSPGVLSFFFDVTYDGKTYKAGLFGGAGTNALKLPYMCYFNTPLDCPEQMLKSIEKLRKETVNIHLGNHPGNNQTLEKRQRQIDEGGNPFIDNNSWENFLNSIEERTKSIISNNDKLIAEMEQLGIFGKLEQ